MTDQAERLRHLLHNQEPKAWPTLHRAARFVTVASGKGGVGKTNLVVNTAVLLDQLGLRVAIIDADLGMANVDILLNLKPRYTLREVVRGERQMSDIVLKGPGNVNIIPGGSGFYELANMDTGRCELIIENLASLEVDLVFIDCAAGISRNVLQFIGAAPELVIVTTPEPTSITDAYGMLKVSIERGLKPETHLVVNRAADSLEGSRVAERFTLACRRFLKKEVNYLGAITDDYSVKRAVQRCSPFVVTYPNSRAAADLRLVSQRLSRFQKAKKTTAGKNFFQRLLSYWQ